MAADLVKIVNSVRDDLKKAYKDTPGETWRKPFVVIIKQGSHNYLDGVKNEQQLIEWISAHLDLPKVDAIVIGRMVVKRSDIIDPNTNEGTIMEKAIMIMGRDMRTGRVRVSITPCHEHRDYRTDEEMDKTAAEFNPAIQGADVAKPIFDVTGKILSRLTAKFGEETILDTRQGHKFLVDPLIQGIEHLRNIDKEVAAAEDMHDPRRFAKDLPNI